MRLFHPGTGTRMSVPDHMAVRYLGQGWAQASGHATIAASPASGAADATPAGSDAPPPGVVTLTGVQVPDGTATEVIDWVGDDRARARAALDAEQAKGDDARTTLVAKLSKLADRP